MLIIKRKKYKLFETILKTRLDESRGGSKIIDSLCNYALKRVFNSRTDSEVEIKLVDDVWSICYKGRYGLICYKDLNEDYTYFKENEQRNEKCCFYFGRRG